jgi:hypothetical protein
MDSLSTSYLIAIAISAYAIWLVFKQCKDGNIDGPVG